MQQTYDPLTYETSEYISSQKSNNFTNIQRKPIATKVFTHCKWEEKHSRRCIWSPQIISLGMGFMFIFLLVLGLIFIQNHLSIIQCKLYYDEAIPLGNVIKIEMNESHCKGLGTTKIIDTDNSILSIYYSLEGFNQNEHNFVESRSAQQLAGTIFTNKQDVISCYPVDTRVINGIEKVLHPCGAAAWTTFNDKFTLLKKDGSIIPIDETNLSVPNNLVTFKNPSIEEINKYRDKVFFWMFPNESTNLQNGNFTNQEKSFINSIQHLLSYDKSGVAVENSHFQVWMHIAPFSSFKKLYGRIEENIELPIDIKVDKHYQTKSFGGRNSIIISTTSWLGTKTLLLGIFFLSLAFIMLFALLLILVIYGNGFFSLIDVRWLLHSKSI